MCGGEGEIRAGQAIRLLLRDKNTSRLEWRCLYYSNLIYIEIIEMMYGAFCSAFGVCFLRRDGFLLGILTLTHQLGQHRSFIYCVTLCDAI